MRATPLILILLSPLLLVPGADAQIVPHYVVLYAHSYGASAILNALQQWSGLKAAAIGDGLSFRLSPVLGEDLRIFGAITFTLYLRASGSFFGTIAMQLLELPAVGTEKAVPGAKVPSGPLTLRTAVQTVTVGIGPIDYQFRAGSAILLRITVDQGSGSGIPLLVWDDSGAPTSLRLPTVSPTAANLSFVGQGSFGRIFQADPNGTQAVMIGAAVRDAIGAYRFNNASFTLAAPNATTISLQVNPANNTDYSSSYSVNLTLSQGQWQIGLILRDMSGDIYIFTDHLWVSPFYPVSIQVVGSDGSSLPNATLRVNFGSEVSWNTTTDTSGVGNLSLPSTEIVGPMNLTIAWLGTQTLLLLPPVESPSMFVLRLAVYDIAVRVVMNTPLLALPIPAATVVLYQKGPVKHALTGIDGVTDFKTIPAGNYTVRVEYFFASYQSPLNVKANGGITIAVPFPHRTITLVIALAVVSLASVVLVRRRRGKLYPRNFSYFANLTHGGLPQACFTLIAGNSGSGKSVLLNTLAAEHLASGKSIYITNTEYPDKIRDNLMRLGIVEESSVRDGRVMFIDAYSAIGGGSSKEEFSVDSHTDLTNLGLSITKCLQRAGPRADVFLDSLNPLVTMLRIDYLINFLQAVAARVKANDGKFCVTTGAGIEKEDMTKLEESADCTIETQLQWSGKGQRRRLRIKKLRDKPYIDHWTRFQVVSGKGIVFFTYTKPDASSGR